MALAEIPRSAAAARPNADVAVVKVDDPEALNLARLGTADLIREALGEVRELVKLEVALAREDVKSEVASAKLGGMALGAAAVLGIAAFTMFMVAIALAAARADGWLAVLAGGGVLVALAVVLGLYGKRALPMKPLGPTKERLTTDLKQLKERIA